MEIGVIMASTDVLALDYIASMCMGINNPMIVSTTCIAVHDGLGIANPYRLKLSEVRYRKSKENFLAAVFTYTMPYDSLVRASIRLSIYIFGPVGFVGLWPHWQ